MDLYISRIQLISIALLFALLLSVFGSMIYSIKEMFGLAKKKTWQMALTKFIASLLIGAGIVSVMVIWTGV